MHQLGLALVTPQKLVSQFKTAVPGSIMLEVLGGREDLVWDPLGPVVLFFPGFLGSNSSVWGEA